MSACDTGESVRAFFIISLNSSSSSAKPPPVPPRVYAGLITTGYPISSATLRPSSIEEATADGSTGSPILKHSSLKSSLSSAFSMLSMHVPSTVTLHSSSTPLRDSCTARLSPVCPPIPGSIASGLSRLTIRAAYSSVRGSIYTLSAI